MVDSIPAIPLKQVPLSASMSRADQMYLTNHLMRKKIILNPGVTFDNVHAKVNPLPASASMTHSDQMNSVGHLVSKDVI